MAGVLSFALGLESSAFSAGLDRAGNPALCRGSADYVKSTATNTGRMAQTLTDIKGLMGQKTVTHRLVNA